MPSEDSTPVIGWREFLSLPDLGVKRIKAKIDTGARTSSLHAFNIEYFDREGVEWVRFEVHPRQHDDEHCITCETPVLDHRHVRSSSGQESHRVVISVNAVLLGETFPIELTLANRDAMGFRMLLGREAMRGRFLVDPGLSYANGKLRKPKK